jgi:hypothetical protein
MTRVFVSREGAAPGLASVCERVVAAPDLERDAQAHLRPRFRLHFGRQLLEGLRKLFDGSVRVEAPERPEAQRLVEWDLDSVHS